MMFPAEPVGLSLVYLPCICVGKCIILVCPNTRPISHPSLITAEPLHKHIHMEIHLIILKPEMPFWTVYRTYIYVNTLPGVIL